MDINTKSLLRFLPMKQDIRDRMLVAYDNYSDDQKLALAKIGWELFYELITSETALRFQEWLAKVEKGEEKLQSQKFKAIEEEVYQEFVEKLKKGEEVSSLEEVRSKIGQMVTSKVAKLS